jgi:soluble lytic murein transglycosylase-like protein
MVKATKLGRFALMGAVGVLAAGRPVAANEPLAPDALPRELAERVLPRLLAEDHAAAERVCASLPQTRGLARIRELLAARAGDGWALFGLLWRGFREPEIASWIWAHAAHHAIQRWPVWAVLIADQAEGPDPGGRHARLVMAEALLALGLEELAGAEIGNGLGSPEIPFAGLPRRLVKAIPPQNDARAETERGWLLLEAESMGKAEKAFQRALKLGITDPETRCWALHGIGRAASTRRRTEDQRAPLERALTLCPDHEMAPEGAVWLARMAFAEEDAAAVHRWAEWLGRRHAEWARTRGVPALSALLNARGYLAKVAARVRARWKRGVRSEPIGFEVMHAWKTLRRRPKRAAKLLEPLVEAGYSRTRESNRGQIEYWLARAHVAAGKQAEALRVYRRLVARYPLSWYGLLGLAEITRVAPGLASALRAEAALAPEAPRPDPAWDESEAARAAARRMIALRRWGLVDAIGVEARAARFHRHPGRAVWTGELLAETGAPTQALHFMEDALVQQGEGSPYTGNPAVWQAAWPRPYPQIVGSECKQHEVPPLFAWAVMRIESRYRATAVSRAGARGLMQLMPGTARWLRQQEAHPDPGADLIDPPENIRLGVKLLGMLRHSFAGSWALAAAAYNGGSGRLRQALKRARTTDLAEIIETLQFPEMQQYTRSVVSAWATYEYLYGCRCLIDLSGALAVPSREAEGPVSVTP